MRLITLNSQRFDEEHVPGMKIAIYSFRMDENILVD